MLADVDRLRHGPDFELVEIEVFDGQRARPEWMIARDPVHVMRDIFANPQLKNDMLYGPERIWTSPSMKVQA